MGGESTLDRLMRIKREQAEDGSVMESRPRLAGDYKYLPSVKYRYIDSEQEWESFFNGGRTPVAGVEYVCDWRGDVLVPIQPGESMYDRFSTILAETAAENEQDDYKWFPVPGAGMSVRLVGGDGTEQIEFLP